MDRKNRRTWRGGYREAAGRVIIQNMLTEGRGEHVLWSSESGGEKHVWGGSNPEGRVHGWYRWGDSLGSLGRIFIGWLLLASDLLASLCTRRCSVLMDQLGRRGGLFLDWASAAFRDGERCGSEELSEDNLSSAGRSVSSGTTASLPLSGRDGGSGRGVPHDFST